MVNMLNTFKKIVLPSTKQFKPKSNWFYAVTTGTYCGELLMFVEESDNDFHFITVPKLINRTVPKDKFELGLTNNIVEPVRSVPKKVAFLLTAQFKYNKKHK